ncbi:ATP synthase F0 subunit 6 (mitochondrion) [Dermacentor variabilis]|uniref:ATP synthase F0 subunit 6 n=1 Tax=Dermacentor variabilis TaxID=34621 RepID=UPI001F13E41B|nr:ATP synthase F0 subunit 6 [Dermacentor variabilis]UKT60492.1 ATP synthase subunit 6 [Dermacentor variabilis]UKU07855.1 ATP synthase subunit 6 [Dermacentor variabilis]UXG58515.1 ATP synthase F0 subunit 6 [Dermacentor variabilis]UXG58524.1 ATP synthase F0 subunit 6 [Dermacentor variabilis]UXG58533.1 ATP synthase F0 subunit 6 [Dermacentor variabilis]
MMNNLFLIFDPSTSINFSNNWCSLILWILIIPYFYWISPSLFSISWKKLLKNFFQEIENNLKPHKTKNCLIISALFIFILCSNICGLFPYVFTSSSHLIFTMFLAFPLWISLIIFLILNKINMMMAHFVPLGSPIFLSFFMVIIETVSNLIRPITLSVRLMANMISGHLLIHLLSSISMFGEVYLFLSLPFMMILLLLESAVAFIQSFVFVILISLYINET